MAAFKTIMTTERLAVLLLQFLLGNSYLLLPASAGCSCSCTDLLTVALLSGSLLLATVAAAAIILLSVPRTAAEAKLQAGVVAPGPGWSMRRALLLLLAAGLSCASAQLAVSTFEFGFRYRRGRASFIFGWPASVLVAIMGLEHGIGGVLLVAAVAQD